MESVFGVAVNYLALVIDIVGAAVIAGAVILSIVPFLGGLRTAQPTLDLRLVRRRLGQGLVLALEFLIAADILRTLLRPSLLDVGVLAVIVILRTILSLSLEYELRRLGPEKSPATESRG